MLKFKHQPIAMHDAACSCAVHDAGLVRIDPTGTAPIRNSYRRLMRQRWATLRAYVRKSVADQDLLGLTPAGLIAQAQFGASKITSFQRFFDYMLNNIVLSGDGTYLRTMIERAYAEGLKFGREQVQQPVHVQTASHKIDTIAQLAIVEMQGIMEVVSQQAVRAVANGLIQRIKPMAFIRTVGAVIQSVGVVRTNAMIEFIVVKAFNEAVLDVYEAAKVVTVGLVPEVVTAARVGDARRKTTRKKGPGSRVSRKVTPSRSTIQRIRRAERELERMGRVNVRTAGDDRVCPVCEEISDEGPYSIDEARGLIPAHPRCRCTFVPVRDRRFARDYNERHDPKGKFTFALTKSGELDETKIPVEGTRKHDVYQAYMQGGREAALKRAEELGLKRSSAMSWISAWKNMGTGTQVAVSATQTIRHVAKTTKPETKMGGRLPISGMNPRLRTAVDEAISHVPASHIAALNRAGVSVRLVDEINGGRVLGRYEWAVNQHTRQMLRANVMVADTYGFGRAVIKTKTPYNTTIHELGHALDHTSGWRYSSAVSSAVEKAAATMSAADRRAAGYYLSNTKEMFAELYRTTYSQSGVAFALPIEKAKQVFASAIDELKKVVGE